MCAVGATGDGSGDCDTVVADVVVGGDVVVAVVDSGGGDLIMLLVGDVACRTVATATVLTECFRLLPFITVVVTAAVAVAVVLVVLYDNAAPQTTFHCPTCH